MLTISPPVSKKLLRVFLSPTLAAGSTIPGRVSSCTHCPREFHELRFDRNRNKIIPQELPAGQYRLY